ncbi:MAG: hypothetical protein ACOYXC_09735, partial [Candidatus Rifleibacteriota bacterium]
MTSSEANALTREGLFRMFAEEACRDGILEEFELKILLNVAKFLRLESEEAQKILGESRDRYKQGLLGEQRRLEPRALYQRAILAVYADGRVDEIEDKMLAGLRKMFGISEDEHRQFIESVVEQKVDEKPMEEVAPPVQKKPVPQHQPGVSTSHLAVRLENNCQSAWFDEHCNWYMLQDRASAEARQAWHNFLNGLLNIDEKEVYNALDAFDDILNPMNRIPLADVFLALGALRWSRVLLKTAFSKDEKGTARVWPGQNVYRRMSVKMGPILITVDHLRIREGLEEYAGMALANLFEDVCMLIERRHAEPLLSLSSMLRMLLKLVQKSEVAHRSAALIGPLTASVFRQGGAVLQNYAGICRDICEVLPPNHPLVIEAARALKAIAPEKSPFPANYQPPDNRPSFNRGFPAAMQRLERL